MAVRLRPLGPIKIISEIYYLTETLTWYLIMTEVYSEYNRINDPYIGSDGRKRITLSIVKDGKVIKSIWVSYPKYLMEKKLNRYLIDDETVDHINGDFTDDRFENLQILSRAENARKAAIGNKYLLGYKQSEEHKRSGEKNGMSKLTSEDILNFRRKFTSGELKKKDIKTLTGMSDKAIQNFLYGQSYCDVPERCISKPGRPKAK